MQEIQIIKIKTQILRIICAAQNSVEEQCILDYICSCTLQKPDVKIKESKIKQLFFQPTNAIAGLKNSQFIITLENQIYLNDNTFKILPDIIKCVEKQVQEIEKRIREDKQKVTCAECNNQRQSAHSTFMSCFCGSYEIKKKDSKTNDIILGKCELYMKVYGRIKELLNQLDSKIIEIKDKKWKIKEKEEQGKKISAYDKYVNKLYEKVRKSDKLKSLKEMEKLINVGEPVQLNLKWLIKSKQKYEPKLDYPELKARRHKGVEEDMFEELNSEFGRIKQKIEREEYSYGSERRQKIENEKQEQLRQGQRHKKLIL